MFRFFSGKLRQNYGAEHKCGAEQFAPCHSFSKNDRARNHSKDRFKTKQQRDKCRIAALCEMICSV